MNKKEFLKPTGKIFILGDEAVARGALEAGAGFTSTYPGTPASDIGDTLAAVSKEAGIYFEYSTNEKVALEAAIGASLSGIRSLVSFKHFGLNVASDSFLPAAYIEARAGLVVVVSDDPECWSSIQSEQDTRYYAKMANVPLLEPTDPQEAKDLTKKAFIISEKFKLPVLVRLTTRVAHTSALVKLDKRPKAKTRGEFKKDWKRYNTFSPRMKEIHNQLIKKLAEVEKYFLESNLNYIENNKKSNLGIIASGVAFKYVQEALAEIEAEVPILKLTATYPVSKKLIGDFVKGKKAVLVAEELEPILEDEVKKIAKKVNCKLKIHGKDLLPQAGEFKPEIVEKAISQFLGKKASNKLNLHAKKFAKLDILRRFPVMCPGCPHRATFYAVKSVAPKAIYGGDIGCCMLGAFPPYQMQDFIYDMGANIGIIHGIKKTTNQKTISFIGDSTFLHAGIPGLINAAYNKSDSLIIILDNRITAMTGHQPNPGMGKTGMGEETIQVDFEELVKACGIKNVITLDPFQTKTFQQKVKEFLALDELAVIVAKRECVLIRWRELRKKGVKIKPFEINQEKCQKCGDCLKEYACPAIYFKDGKYQINPDLCNSCGMCAKICPHGAIGIKKD